MNTRMEEAEKQIRDIEDKIMENKQAGKKGKKGTGSQMQSQGTQWILRVY